MSDRSPATTHDEYAGFAERYDGFFGAFGEPAPRREAFWRQVLGDAGVRRVLDCACGTGRDAYALARLGFEVTGSDLSEAMLAQAARNLAAAPHPMQMPLLQVDYRQLPETFGPGAFDAVVCLSTSIAHMPDEEQMLRALGSMHGVLRDGGLLVLSQGTTDRQWREKPRFILGVNRADLVRLFVIDYHASGRGARYNILDILPGAGGDAGAAGVMTSWSTDYPLIPLRDDQERLLRAAGFRRVDFYGGWDRQPYDRENSRQLITVAQR